MILVPTRDHYCSHCGGQVTCTNTGNTVTVISYSYGPSKAEQLEDDRPRNTPGGPLRRPVIERRRPLPVYQAPKPRPTRRAVHCGITG